MAREFDESDVRIRPARSTRPRSKDRPSHSDAIHALVTTVDRGRTTCITDEGVIVTAMRSRELGPKSVVVGDHVGIVGDTSGTVGSLARIVIVQERKNSLSRTVDDNAKVERTIVANIDQLIIVVAATKRIRTSERSCYLSKKRRWLRKFAGPTQGKNFRTRWTFRGRKVHAHQCASAPCATRNWRSQ